MATALERAVRDVMSTSVIAVHPETSVHEVAEILIARGISGLPVVDGDGVPVGIVSEADLIQVDEGAGEHRRDRLLGLLSNGESVGAAFVEHLRQTASHVQRIMRSPVLSVDEATSLGDVATLMTANRIKRVPVTRNGKLVGIVTRADLVRAMSPAHVEALPSRIIAAGGPDPRRSDPKTSATSPQPVAAGITELSAAAFRRVARSFHIAERDARLEVERLALRKQQEEVALLLAEPFTERDYEHLVARAARAAEQGVTECAALRFPSALCTDGGRAINSNDPDWPATLRGKAALFFLRWRADLRPCGFQLTAHIASFPNGVPGDVELTLVWGSDE